MQEHAGGLQLGFHVGQLELQRLEIGNGFPEGLAFCRVLQRLVERELRGPQCTCGDVQPASVEARHGVFEALAFLANQMICRHLAVVKMYERGGLCPPSHLAFVCPVRETIRAFLDHHGRDALRAVIAGAHHGQIEIGKAAAGNERLGAIEFPLIAIEIGAGAQCGGIRARSRFGQAIGGDPFHRAHGRQPGLALLFGAEGIDHPGTHVVDRNEGGDGGTAIGERLEDQRCVEPAQPRAADILADIDAGHAEFADRADHIFRKVARLVPLDGLRCDVLIGKGAGHVTYGLLFVTQCKIHRTASLRFGEKRSRQFIVGIENSAPSFTPEGQREVMVLVLV